MSNPGEGVNAYDDEWPGDGGGRTAPLPPPLPASPGAESEVPPAVRVPRFCGTCGAPWHPHWTRCEPCSASAITGFGAGQATTSPEPEGIIRIRSSMALYFTLLAVSVVAVVATLAGATEVTTDLAASIGFSVVVVIWCGFSDPRSLVRLFKPARPVWYLVAIAAAVGTVAVAFAVVETLHRGLGVEKLNYSPPYLAAGYGTWVVVLVVCVQPAVFEELAFRGVMLTSLRPTLSDVEAVLVSAMLFMTLHISPAAFPHTLAMGVAAGFMRLASKSILPCMLLHFVHNGAVIAAELYLGI